MWLVVVIKVWESVLISIKFIFSNKVMSIKIQSIMLKYILTRAMGISTRQDTIYIILMSRSMCMSETVF
jgi:hypothetical protein